MMLTGKTIGILVANGYEDLEFWVPYMRMIEAGARIVVIAPASGETYASKSKGLTARSDVGAHEISAGDLHALLVPGGWAPDRLRRDQNILRLVREMHSAGKILGFICHAG
jgi:protease I